MFDLFRECGLGPPPRLIWPLVEADDDVGAAVERFLQRVGAEDGLTALLRAESGMVRMPPVEAERVREALLSGDAARMAAALAQARAVAPAGVTEHWPEDLLPAGVRNAVREHPAIEEIARLLDDHARLRAALMAAWPKIADERTGARMRTTIGAFEDAEATVLERLGARGDPASEIARMAEANALLRSLLGPARAPAVSTETGAAIGAAANWPEALQRWKELRWRHHPDRPGATREQAEDGERVSELLDSVLTRWELVHRLAGTT